MNLYHLSPRLAKKGSSFCAPLISAIANLISQMGPIQTHNHHIHQMAPKWTNTHNAHISHTLMAQDLIFFHLRWKTRRIKKRRRVRPLFFADEMKGSCCSDLSKPAKVQCWVRLPGDFFTVFSLKLHGGREEYEERKRWYYTAVAKGERLMYSQRGRRR